MSDGRLMLRDCVPTGPLDMLAFAPGAIPRRTYTLTANAAPEFLEFLDRGDPLLGNVVRGHHGKVFDADGTFLAEVDTATATLNPETGTWRPPGQLQSRSYMLGYSVDVVLEGVYIRDDPGLFVKLWNQILAGGGPGVDIQIEVSGEGA